MHHEIEPKKKYIKKKKIKIALYNIFAFPILSDKLLSE